MTDELIDSLDDLEAELDDLYDETEPFGGLDGKAYTRVSRARDGVLSIRRYLEWRKDHETS